MNPKEMKAKLAELLKAFGETDDRSKKQELLTEAEALKSDIENAERAESLKAWGNTTTGTPNMAFDAKRAGVDVVTLSQNENLLEQEGTLSEKALKYISEPSYKAAWIRHAANPNGTDAADHKTLSEGLRVAKNFVEGLDSGGGYLVPAAIQMEVVRRDPQISAVLSAVRTLPVTSSDRLQAPRLDYQSASDDSAGDIFSNPMRIQWTGEAQAPGTTTRPNFGQIEIPVFEGQFEMPFSRSLADDSSLFESLLVEELRNSYLLGMENVVINGNGVAKPTGILINPGGTLQPPTQNVGNPVTADGLTDWIYSLPPQYAGEECRWLTNRTDVYRTWAKIKDSASNYIFGLTMNISGGLATARNETLFGYNGIFSPFMPNSGSANNVGIFGNFRKAYWWVERLGMQVMFQDIPREAFRYAVVRYRVGGQVVQPRALRVAVQS